MLWQARGKSLGVRLSGWLLAVLTALWVVYLLSFSGAFADGPPLLATAAIAVARYNSFNDLLLQVLLGYGMVLILMEDLNREMDAAYSELAVAHGRLRQASLHDSLTGLLNRRAFDEGVGLATTRGTHGSVVMIDTDNLKIINDTHGHAAGDALLRQVADTLRRAVRAADKVYRWGGDEFLVVLPRSRSPEVRTRLVAALAEAGNLRLGEPGAEVEVEVAVSLGAADYRDAAELTAAIRRADLEMYEEKKRRREAARRIGRTA
jgi:diguanylate cyclase (GGDEF)-like protein